MGVRGVKFILIFLISFPGISNARSGKNIYNSICSKCHNINPTKPGSIGPDVFGSSLELITKKTQERSYPVGYKPKRKTKVMPKIPMTKEELVDLHKYINSFKR